MGTTGTWDITCKRGEPLVLQLGNSTYPGIAFAGVAAVWTGCSAVMEVRAGDETTTLLASATTADGSIVLGSNGNVTCTVPPAITARIPKGRYRWDLRIVDSLGAPHYYLEGGVVIGDRVTIGGGP